MKVLIGFITGVILLICFSSCQKEINWGLPNNTQSDSIHLTQLIGLDSTLPAGSDTVEKSVFTYDNLKRLSRINSFSIGIPDTLIYDFSYTGTDSVPVMLIEKEIDYNGPGTYSIDTIYYSYNNALVSRDSLVQWIYPGNIYDNTLIRNFLTSANQARMYVREYGYISGVYTLLNFDSAVYNVNYNSGNISSQTWVSGGVAFYNNIQVTYDMKPNPLGKIIKLRYPCFENFPFNNWSFQKNNFLQAQYQEISALPSSEIYTYVYRPDGYPISSTFDSGGLSAANKYLYFYAPL